MDFVRTPDDRFESLPGFPYAPSYVDVGGLRMSYVDEGPRDGHPVLMLHGEPSWGFLYRKMIDPVVAAGHRVIVPDLIGFGRSDKPTDRAAYTYAAHLAWLRSFWDQLALAPATVFCQDWGGLLALRILAEEPERFARVVASNTFLPTGREPTSDAFVKWLEHVETTEHFDIGRILQRATVSELPDDVVAAYEAPFPDESYKAGARTFPALVPISTDDPESAHNQAAWMQLMKLQIPFLTAFGDSDPITRGGDRFLQRMIPGARGQGHRTIPQAGHFLQEDQGAMLAEIIVELIAST